MDRMRYLPLHAALHTGIEIEVDQDITISDFTVAFYQYNVPPFVKAALETVYESLYSTLPQFQYRPDAVLADVHTYVEYQDGMPHAILLFRISGCTAMVLNEVMTIGGADIDRFADYIFKKFESVSVISFHAIQSDKTRPAYPCHRFEVMEDIVLSLPASKEEYLAALGKSTRKTVKYYSNKLKRAFPSFTHEVFTKDKVTPEHVRAIIGMKVARMEKKNKTAMVSEVDIDHVLHMVRNYGIVGIATIDGKMCAGWIGYRVGKNDFMDMFAYDIAYEEYRLGTLCCYLAITDCIERGGKECHFQWGQDDYKFRFLGQQRDLVDLVIYRSRIAMLAHAGKFWRSAAAHVKRRAKSRMGCFKSA